MTVVHPCVCTLFVPSSAELEASQRTTEVLKEDLYAAEQELMKEKALNRNAEARITSVRFHSKQCHWLLPNPPPPHTHTPNAPVAVTGVCPMMTRFRCCDHRLAWEAAGAQGCACRGCS